MILIGRGLDLRSQQIEKEGEGSGSESGEKSRDGRAEGVEAERPERRTLCPRSIPVQFLRCGEEPHKISGDNSLRDPPVPIPNTEVKPQHAEGTWRETARKTRSSPDYYLGTLHSQCPSSLID